MNDAKSPQEPSMEEILASIRRIISEDTDTPKGGGMEAAPAAMAFDDDVLELTDRFDEPAAPAHTSSANIFDDEDDFPAQAAPKFNLDEQDDDGFLSHAAASATADAFASLQHQEPEPPAYHEPEEEETGPGLTVERLVRETLKPILKDWLDRNLPPMVEQIVRSEIERANRRR
jgi:cell pole-organizing protein PopZ